LTGGAVGGIVDSMAAEASSQTSDKPSATAALALAILLLGAPACHGRSFAASGRAEPGAADRQVDRLKSLITLPAKPTEVWFEQVPRGPSGGAGPTDNLLVAVLRFDPADLARVTAVARQRPGSPPRISSAAHRTWFPDAVKGALRPYDYRSVAVRGDKFDASLFAKSPFGSGYFVAVEGGEYVILVLETT
jgi:hypothetical protein